MALTRLSGRYLISSSVIDEGARAERSIVYTPPASWGSSPGSGVRCGASAVDSVSRRRLPAAIVASVGKTWIWYSVTAPVLTGFADACVYG